MSNVLSGHLGGGVPRSRSRPEARRLWLTLLTVRKFFSNPKGAESKKQQSTLAFNRPKDQAPCDDKGSKPESSPKDSILSLRNTRASKDDVEMEDGDGSIVNGTEAVNGTKSEADEDIEATPVNGKLS